MAAPTLIDGLRRGFEEFAIPSIATFILILVVNQVSGEIEAGLVFILFAVAGLLELYSKAKYWNSQYTLGVVILSMISLILVPGIIGTLIPELLSTIEEILSLIILLAIGMMLPDKVGIA